MRLGERILTLNKKEEEKTGPRVFPMPCWKSGHNAKDGKVLEKAAFEQQPSSRARFIGWGKLS